VACLMKRDDFAPSHSSCLAPVIGQAGGREHQHLSNYSPVCSDRKISYFVISSPWFGSWTFNHFSVSFSNMGLLNLLPKKACKAILCLIEDAFV